MVYRGDGSDFLLNNLEKIWDGSQQIGTGTEEGAVPLIPRASGN